MERKIFVFLFFISYVFASDLTPLPQNIRDIDAKKAALGHKLFFDPILSKDGTVACVNCHVFSLVGSDARKVSVGIGGKLGNINSPTVFNARYNFRQFWDGRARDLKEQATGPITNPVEMGNNFPNLIRTLKNSPYKKEFDSIYKDGITKKSIIDAIAEYEKTLITPNSPFDRYLRGEKSALTSEQKKGYELFKSEGCIACHNGINIGGNLYAKFGVYFNAKSKSLGRYEVTHNELDKYFFKVPTLRNIELTAPYLHDGRFKTLKGVVAFMMHYQLGKKVDSKKVEYLVDFLKSLTGEIPKP